MPTEKKELNIVVNLDNLTMADWRPLLLIQEGKITPETIDFMDRAVVGGIEKLPFLAFKDVFGIVCEKITAILNPVDESGKV